MEETSIPQWAYTLLEDIEKETNGLKERHLELKSSTDKKERSFEELKSKKEAEMRLKLHIETTRYNNIISQKKDSKRQDPQYTLNHNREIMTAKIQEIDRQYEIYLDDMRKLKKAEDSIRKDIKDAQQKDLELSQKLQKLHKDHGESSTTEKVKQHYPSLPSSVFLTNRDTQSQLKYSSIHTEIARMVLSDRKAAIFDLVFHPKKYFIHALLRSRHEIGPVLFHKLLNELIKMHEYHGKELELFAFIFSQEINQSGGPNDVLKSDSVSSTIFEIYGLRCASKYLKDTIRSIIMKVIQDDKEYCIDEDRLPIGEDLASNRTQLKDICSQILKSLSLSSSKIPYQFRLLSECLKQCVMRRYPNEWSKILSFHIFSFISQAVASPDKYNLEINDIGLNARKCLGTLSKILENVSIGNHFQEEKMLAFNDIVAECIGIVKKYILDMFKPSQRNMWSTLVPTHSQVVVLEVVKVFHELSSPSVLKIMEELLLLDKGVYKHKNTYFQHELLSISADQLLGLSPKQFTLENYFVMGFIEFIVHKDQSFLDAITTMVSQKMIDGSKVSKLVVPLLLYRDQSGERIESFLRNVMRKDMLSMSQGMSKCGISRMVGGFGSQVYSDYAGLVARDFISSILNQFIEVFRKGRLGKLDKKSIPTLKILVDIIVRSLKKLPKTIWRVHNFFSKQLVDVSKTFMLLYLIAPAIQNPDIFCPGVLNSKELEKYKIKTQAIVDFLIALALGQPSTKGEDKHTQELIQLLKPIETELIESIDAWVQDTQIENDQASPKLTWSEVRSGLITLLNHADNDYESFEVVLCKQVESDTIFQLSDLFWAVSQKPGPRSKNLEIRLSKQNL